MRLHLYKTTKKHSHTHTHSPPPPHTHTPSSFHSRRLDGDAAFLLVLPRVREPCLPCAAASDDPGLGDERVSQSRLAVVHVSYDRHVANVGSLVHDGTDLVRGGGGGDIGGLGCIQFVALYSLHATCTGYSRTV